MKVVAALACLALCLFAALPTVHGRLSETATQIEARLGPPVVASIEDSPFGAVGSCTSKVFVKNGVRCDVYFLAGASVAEFYRKEDATFFEDGEIQSLLSVNAGSSTWHDPTTAKGGRYWSRNDGKATASYQEANGRDVFQTQLSIVTPAFDAEYDRSQKAKEGKRLDGF